ncbi:hypothetical protein [Mesorhizobium sp. WSM4904]|uniref:hypothetical protein n=1 Tax=Mesorhizobium sp. WSM4904 TaxID=3038545 RepID=UPI002418915E|nr:hypothetical protein [Mesorhizobium sp. WSM4904]WFP61245.1 hypothetical protein QAZ47_22480 [Mesorhizobium sp. WSM4904]
MARAGLKFNANYPDPTMTVSLVRDDDVIDSFKLPIDEVSKLAGTALGVAAEAHRVSGKPNPHMSRHEEVSLTSVQCTGLNIAPGRTPTSLTLMFYFGEAVLGIEVPHQLAQKFAQRMLTSAAGGSAQ